MKGLVLIEMIEGRRGEGEKARERERESIQESQKDEE